MSRDILIQPHSGSNNNGEEPKIIFRGSGSSTPITLTVEDDGTILFKSGSTTLWSIDNTISGSIFAINDIGDTNNPIFNVNNDGLIRFGKPSQQSTTEFKLHPTTGFHFSGSTHITGSLNTTGSSIISNTEFYTVYLKPRTGGTPIFEIIEPIGSQIFYVNSEYNWGIGDIEGNQNGYYFGGNDIAKTIEIGSSNFGIINISHSVVYPDINNVWDLGRIDKNWDALYVNQIKSTNVSGSFSGSFEGDGSGLTGIIGGKWTGSDGYIQHTGADVQITGSLLTTGSITFNDISEIQMTGSIYMSGSTLDVSASQFNFKGLPDTNPGVNGRLYTTSSDAFGGSLGLRVICVSQG